MLEVLGDLLQRSLQTADQQPEETWDPRSRLFPKALEAYDDPSRHRVWPTGRGGAKTTTGQMVEVADALATPGCAVLYISDTIGRAKAVAWPDFMELAEETRGKVNQAELTITWENKSRLFCTGADNQKLFNRKRGIKKVKTVFFDEAQDWNPDLLKYAITKVFMPRLGDLEKVHGIKGRIIVAGTGTKDDGYFYEIATKPELGFSRKTWTQWDNPHIADPDGEFAAACQALGVGPDDPGIRREFFAEFNSGGDLQIFQKVTVIPRAQLPTTDLRLVVGVDFGTVDAAAAAVWLWSPYFPKPVQVSSTREFGLSGSEQVRFARQVAAEAREMYQTQSKPVIVGDGGGLGKALIMDLQESERAWEVIPAEKQDKVPNIRIMAGDLRTGAAAICDDMQEFLTALKRPEWHPEHRGERIRGHMPDAIDASYMAYRYVKERFRYLGAKKEETPDERHDRERLERISQNEQRNSQEGDEF